jgi:hypothetical protein
MDWQGLLTTVLSTTVIVGAVAWLARALISQWLARDIERFKGTLATENTRSVEELRVNLQLEAQRQQIVFGSLHSRRAEVIAELYGKLDELDRAVHAVVGQQWFRAIREDSDRLSLSPKEPYELRAGYEVLSREEQDDVEDLSRVASDFSQFYGRLKIYFTPEACDLLNRFGVLSSFLASNYHNIALKDREGKPYVNPRVKEVWDGAVGTIPKLKVLLEEEFRSLLGVTPTTKKPGVTGL